mmetsp:Transcript_30202/g.83064  ORF Transcript_30202/g.83064 Transcript_30202/m.83064 type:complete len:259 (+) Transcript_30202:43-819(+)
MVSKLAPPLTARVSCPCGQRQLFQRGNSCRALQLRPLLLQVLVGVRLHPGCRLNLVQQALVLLRHQRLAPQALLFFLRRLRRWRLLLPVVIGRHLLGDGGLFASGVALDGLLLFLLLLLLLSELGMPNAFCLRLQLLVETLECLRPNLGRGGSRNGCPLGSFRSLCLRSCPCDLCCDAVQDLALAWHVTLGLVVHERRQMRRRCPARRVRRDGQQAPHVERVENPLRLHILPSLDLLDALGRPVDELVSYGRVAHNES